MNAKIMTPARTTGQQLMRTSDGRIYERMDWDRGVIHQKILSHYEPEACADYSMDGGEHWDWEWGTPDGRGGWHRRGS